MTGEPPREETHPFEKEREEKDDGRYIIFYAFEDEEAGNTHPDEEGSG